MRYVIKILLICLTLLTTTKGLFASEFFENLLMNAAKDNGFLDPEITNRAFDKSKSAIGKKLFESKKLSFNGDMSCSNCHLDKFSSADGLPNAIGIGGHGEGTTRMGSGGALVPRNTLPLWGRANVGFNAFFWDGKVESVDGTIVSQFGEELPSSDALEVAVHLPFVEIREMVNDNEDVNNNLKTESVDSALLVQKELIARVKKDSVLGEELAKAFNISVSELEFQHITKSLVHFFADKFRLKQSKFSQFMDGRASLTDDELKGGLLFYGKGQCSSCHSGPHFSNFSFHTIIFPQAGPGKNGFGIDYGRFNTTFDVKDLYKFRTPPLHNVAKTAPYGHSGSVYDLKEALILHYDPLSIIDLSQITGVERRDLFQRMTVISDDQPMPSHLDENEVKQIIKYLYTLSF